MDERPLRGDREGDDVAAARRALDAGAGGGGVGPVGHREARDPADDAVILAPRAAELDRLEDAHHLRNGKGLVGQLNGASGEGRVDCGVRRVRGRLPGGVGEGGGRTLRPDEEFARRDIADALHGTSHRFSAGSGADGHAVAARSRPEGVRDRPRRLEDAVAVEIPFEDDVGGVGGVLGSGDKGRGEAADGGV